MNNELNLPPTIQICSLEAVRIADTSIYEGVITIEDWEKIKEFIITKKRNDGSHIQFTSNVSWSTTRCY